MPRLLRYLPLAAVVLAGCATAPRPSTATLNPQPLTATPQSPPQASNGSVFSPNAHVSLFQDHRLWRNGDLVTIDITQNASASTSDDSNLQRQATTNNSVSAFLGLTPAVGHIAGGQISPSFNTSDQTQFKGQGQTSESNTVQGQVTAVVQRVEPNGILALAGRTNVNVNGDVRTIQITGYARPEDIGPDNSIPSTDLANMNVQYVGAGPTESAHHVPWLQNILNHYWPF